MLRREPDAVDLSLVSTRNSGADRGLLASGYWLSNCDVQDEQSGILALRVLSGSTPCDGEMRGAGTEATDYQLRVVHRDRRSFLVVLECTRTLVSVALMRA